MNFVKILSVAGLLALVGCGPKPTTVIEPIATGVTTSIKITDEIADPPEFKRTYVAKVNDEVTMKVQLHSSFGTRYDMSELDQKDGKWILFDLDRPADKILDRDLLPTINILCQQIRQIDNDYIKSNPDQYVDKDGHTWKRIN